MTDSLRADKWLWFARFFKSRNLASMACTKRLIRINGIILTKSNRLLHVGDVLTFAQGKEIKVIKVASLGVRRGPAREAHSLYEDLSPPPESRKMTQIQSGRRDAGAGRPTKSDRRALERLRNRYL